MRFITAIAILVLTATSVTAIYPLNCKGSFKKPRRDDCVTAVQAIDTAKVFNGSINEFSYQHCYVAYKTETMHDTPTTGQQIVDAANKILTTCTRKGHGSMGTDNQCDKCHVTINYRHDRGNGVIMDGTYGYAGPIAQD